jgi:FCD domain
MAARLHDWASGHQSEDLTELRQLLELAAVRRLADRGLSDQECARVRRMADATMRAARNRDVAGYLQADMLFHQSLLELTRDPALAEFARLALAADPSPAARSELSNDRAVREAIEHHDLAVLIADGMVSEADRLLRLHLSRQSPAGPVAERRANLEPSCLRAALIESLTQVRASDDPVVTFGGLPQACVPEFADGCQVELADGADPTFRAVSPVSAAEDLEAATRHQARPDQVISTPFQVAARVGYASCGGVVTYWWTGRMPSNSDAVIADILVKLLVALVDQERLMAAVRRAEDRAARLALEAVSGRTIQLATGIVMQQRGLAPDSAEDLLRESAKLTAKDLYEVAASVVRSGALTVARTSGQAAAAPPDRRRWRGSSSAGGR